MFFDGTRTLLREHVRECKKDKKEIRKTIDGLHKEINESVAVYGKQLGAFREEQMAMHDENRKNFTWMLRTALATAVATILSLMGALATVIWYVVTHPWVLR